jgi:predicted RNase H-like nuclease (RuvC/YqgF family)
MINGYLYCFSNKSIPGILKVDATEQMLDMRLNEVNNKEEDEEAKLLARLAEVRQEKAIKDATKNIKKLRSSMVLKVETEKEQLRAQVRQLEIEIETLNEKKLQILSGLYDEDLIQSELRETQNTQFVNLTTPSSIKTIKINESKEDEIPRVRDTNKARTRPNLNEIFNTDTEIKFKIGKNHHTLTYENGRGILLNDKRFTTLASVITELKELEGITKTRQYNAYDFTEWFSKKEGKFLPTSPYFTTEVLEKNGKLN